MTPQPQSDNAPPAMSEVGRISDVYLDPKAAFADIVARPRWIVPLVLVVLAALAFTYTYTTHVGWERFMRQSIETSSRAQSLTPEQRETQITQGAKFAPIMGYVFSVVGIPVMALIVAAVLLLTAKMIGASLNFKQMFAISSYAMLPGLIATVLAIIVMFLKNPDDFNLQNPLFFNLGAAMEPPPNTGKFLYSLATSIDLFTFWTILLLAIGITMGARKLPLSKAVMAVAAPWVLWILVKGGWAAMFG